MRTQFTQLPTYQELVDILAHEAVRHLPRGKEDFHYGDFSSIVALLLSYGLSASFFEKDFKFEELQDRKRSEQVAELFDVLSQRILESQDVQEQQALFNKLYDYLSEEDKLEKADLIFVFGSSGDYRIEKAVNLYKNGYAPKILISGRGPFYELQQERLPEADRLAEHARCLGVPEGDLILERESITVPDNVKRSLNALESAGILHQSIILVNSPFSQRRGWAHFTKMSDEGIKLTRCNAPTGERFTRDNWYRNEVGTRVILKEFFGLRISSVLNTL